MNKFSIIVGYRASDRAIGANGKLPWKISKDMTFFRKITSQKNDVSKKNVVIMGRKTFESMTYKPLCGRINIVCTSMDMLDMPDVNLYFAKSLEEALEKCRKININGIIEKIFVIGGEQLYRCAIEHPMCCEIIVNEFSKCAYDNITSASSVGTHNIPQHFRRIPDGDSSSAPCNITPDSRCSSSVKYPGTSSAPCNAFDLDTIQCDAFFPEIDENKYDLVLDYNSIDSIAEITPENIENDNDSKKELFIKIRYKKYIRHHRTFCM